MKRFIPLLILAICFFVQIDQATASHLAAADINYKCLGGSQYEITLKIYRDCSGINAPASAFVSINSSCSALNISLSQTNIQDISPLCSSSVSSCNGGTQPGYEEVTYVGTATIPNCADWVISYSTCCRNPISQNVVNPSANSLYVEAHLNNASGICNSSPTFANPPIFMICDSMLYNVTHHAIETDGDSLVYSLATPLGGNNQPLTFSAGYSASQPFATHGAGVNFNSQNGQLSFIPDGPFAGVFDVLVEEYRNGQLIGSSRRSLQLIVMSCGPNQPISLNNVLYNNQGTWQAQGTSTSFQACPGEQLEFILDVSDADLSDSLSLDSLRSSILSQYPNASIQFNYLSSNQALVWVTIPAVQLGSFSLGFKDNACPVNHLQSWIFEVAPRPYCAVIRGYAALDNSPNNCMIDAGEIAVPGALVTASKNGVTLYGTTDATGYYEIIADTGSYSVNFNNYLSTTWQPCANGVSANLPNYNTADTIDFPIESLFPNCPIMFTDIGTPLLRRCFNGVYSVQYGNIGGVDAPNSYVEVSIDTNYITLDSASLAYTVNGDVYTFQLGQVDIFDQGFFQIYYTTECDTSVQGHTACVSAHIYPDSLCYASASWDGVDVQLNAVCLSDSIEFTISNLGTNMGSAYNYRILEDGVQIQSGTFQLANANTRQILVSATGATYRLETDQSPNHPSSSNPSITVENCAPNGTTTSTGWVNVFAEDDGAFFLSIDCQEIRGSWDPNEKLAFPQGYGSEHYIDLGQELEYHLHFQNTGNDTAFNVVLVDTLQSTLDPTSIVMGASSHAYRWEITGTDQPVLKVYFDNIMLPDSNVNEVASHGFVKFKIAQAASNTIGTRIENFVDIYFDFNPPVRTNTAFHTIGENYITVISSTHSTEAAKDLNIVAMPNPFQQQTQIVVEGADYETVEIELYDVMGRMLQRSQTTNSNTIELNTVDLPAGLYFCRVYGDQKFISSLQLVKQ
jgi:uncharacterized repeat protein (TIGR01451 family)